MVMWLQLNGWQQADGVCYIRLACTPELQSLLDCRYPIAEWQNMTIDGALAAIGSVVVKHSNKAAEKDLFYNLRQGQHETVSAFFTRAHKVTANANFTCP